MTFKTPAAYSPTVVNTEAICSDSSTLQPRPLWQPPSSPGTSGEGRGGSKGLHPPFVSWVGSSSNPALPTQQGALKDIGISHVKTPPQSPSGAFIKWQQASFVQHGWSVNASHQR